MAGAWGAPDELCLLRFPELVNESLVSCLFGVTCPGAEEAKWPYESSELVTGGSIVGLGMPTLDERLVRRILPNNPPNQPPDTVLARVNGGGCVVVVLEVSLGEVLYSAGIGMPVD